MANIDVGHWETKTSQSEQCGHRQRLQPEDDHLMWSHIAATFKHASVFSWTEIDTCFYESTFCPHSGCYWHTQHHPSQSAFFCSKYWREGGKVDFGPLFQKFLSMVPCPCCFELVVERNIWQGHVTGVLMPWLWRKETEERARVPTCPSKHPLGTYSFHQAPHPESSIGSEQRHRLGPKPLADGSLARNRSDPNTPSPLGPHLLGCMS